MIIFFIGLCVGIAAGMVLGTVVVRASGHDAAVTAPRSRTVAADTQETGEMLIRKEQPGP